MNSQYVPTTDDSHLIGTSQSTDSSVSPTAYSSALPKNYSNDVETRGTMRRSKPTSSYPGMEKQKRLLQNQDKRRVRFEENEKEHVPRRSKAQQKTSPNQNDQKGQRQSDTKSGSGDNKSRRPTVPPIPVSQEFPEQDDFFSQIFSNKGNIGMKALMGAVGGALYGAFQNLSSRRMLSYKLYPEPERFDLDQQMSRLFHRLASYRNYHEEAYCRALENTDRLFMHEASIWRTGARFGDVSLSKMWLMNVATDIFNFRMQISNPKDRARFNIISRAILDRLILHHQNIVRRCRALRPRHEFIKKKMERDPYHYACADFVPSEDESKAHECHSCGMLRQHHRVRPSASGPKQTSSNSTPSDTPSQEPGRRSNNGTNSSESNGRGEPSAPSAKHAAYVDVR